MRILITNDDGIRAPGLFALARAAQQLGTVKVVAPDRERSACGHSMTLRDPLRIREAHLPGLENIEAYEVNGVPVDCVNIGLTIAYPEGCDLVLSGINNGPNLGFDVTYSGTVAGALEGVINGIPSIAFSMATFVDGAPLHFETGELWVQENLARLAEIAATLDGSLINVNIPAIAYQEVNGSRWTAKGKRVYEDRVEERSDPWGRTYFWQGGVVVMRTNDPNTDVYAVNEGYVSMTPVRVDWTDYAMLAALAEKEAELSQR